MPLLNLPTAALYFARYYNASGNASNNDVYRHYAQNQSANLTNALSQYTSGALSPADIHNPYLDLAPNGFFETTTNTRSGIFPFGAFAPANYAGNSAMFNPYAPRGYNFDSATLQPYQFVPQFINLSAQPPPDLVGIRSSDIAPQTISPDLTPDMLPPEAQSGMCSAWDFECWKSLALDTAKNFGLLLFALILLIFGLYFLAKQTDAGQIAIGAAKKAATSGAL